MRSVFTSRFRFGAHHHGLTPTCVLRVRCRRQVDQKPKAGRWLPRRRSTSPQQGLRMRISPCPASARESSAESQRYRQDEAARINSILSGPKPLPQEECPSHKVGAGSESSVGRSAAIAGHGCGWPATTLAEARPGWFPCDPETHRHWPMDYRPGLVGNRRVRCVRIPGGFTPREGGPSGHRPAEWIRPRPVSVRGCARWSL